MTITAFGIVVLFSPFIFGALAYLSRRHRTLFVFLLLLTALAAMLALVTVMTVAGHTSTTSSFSP